MIKHYTGFDWTAVKKDNNVHYASKEETRIDGPLILGTLPAHGGDRKSKNFMPR